MRTPADEWEAIVRETIAAESWVMDGNYGGTMAIRLAAADRRSSSTWVGGRVCDALSPLPPSTAAARVRHGPCCPENLPDLEFVRWIWTYPSRRRPGDRATR